MLKNFFGEKIDKVVFVSQEQVHDLRERNIYGIYYRDTNIFNVFPEGRKGKKLGKFLVDREPDLKMQLCGVLKDGTVAFYNYGTQIKYETYDLYQNIFSRNKGILETSIMSKKRAVILGCGSVGSLVAMELARSGVGHFYLMDADIMEYHNICRHQCGIEDVGDLKVNVVERKILNINPKAEVIKFSGIVQNAPEEQLKKFCAGDDTIFVGCADNREADVYSNRIASYFGASFLSIGFWERAFAGEIFYHIPHRNMPCYACALGDGGGMSVRVEANHHIYSNQENVEGVKFEPGISVDINFITCIGIKLIIDILNANDPNYTPRLLNDLQQYTLVCNTSNPKIGGEMVEIFSYPLQVTTSLKVSFRNSCVGKVCRYEN